MGSEPKDIEIKTVQIGHKDKNKDHKGIFGTIPGNQGHKPLNARSRRGDIKGNSGQLLSQI